jgi:hypothetical protein
VELPSSAWQQAAGASNVPQAPWRCHCVPLGCHWWPRGADSTQARHPNEGQGDAMKRIVLIAAISLLACGSASATCKSDAADKKLAGAALNSFMKKCETDAKGACSLSAGEKKLSGAAKTSFTTKCVRDKVGK